MLYLSLYLNKICLFFIKYNIVQFVKTICMHSKLTGKLLLFIILLFIDFHIIIRGGTDGLGDFKIAVGLSMLKTLD